MLVAAEAAWATLLFDAVANGAAVPGRTTVDLPYLAMALPAVVAVFVAASIGDQRLGSHHRLWRLLLALVVVAGAGITAGVVAGVGSHESIWPLLTHPWALGRAGRAAKWAWAVSIVSWGRGTWLGLSPPSLRHSSTSLVVGAVVFLTVFVERHVVHQASYARATGSAEWLLFVFFPVGMTAAAWLHEQAVARAALRRTSGRRSGAWLVALVVPLALVALVALLIGGGAGPVATGVADGARAIVGAIEAAGNWLVGLLRGVHIRASGNGPSSPSLPGPPKLPNKYGASAHTTLLSVLAIVLTVVVAIAALVVLVLLIRWVLQARRRRRARDEAVDVDRESIFSWGHLGTQLRATIRKFLVRLRSRHCPSLPVADEPAMSNVVDVDDGTARAAYRRLLRAARATGRGRAPSETTHELETRLAAALSGTLDERALTTLTAIYDRARYGGEEPSDPERTAAFAAADSLVMALCAAATALATSAAPSAVPPGVETVGTPPAQS